jgi:hypothetical protein
MGIRAAMIMVHQPKGNGQNCRWIAQVYGGNFRGFPMQHWLTSPKGDKPLHILGFRRVDPVPPFILPDLARVDRMHGDEHTEQRYGFSWTSARTRSSYPAHRTRGPDNERTGADVTTKMVNAGEGL